MRKLIVANWKAHKNITEAREWLAKFNKEVLPEGVEVVVCPAIPLLKAFEGVPFKLGVQDISVFGPCPHTGEVTVEQIKDLVDYVLVGHSERRQDCGETDEIVIKKASAVVEAGFTPIVCVSDIKQVKLLAKKALPENSFVLAYEPLDAISTAASGHVYEVTKVVDFIKEVRPLLKEVPLIYGGSVTAKNLMPFAREERLAGVLVGQDSLVTADFLNIIRSYAVC